MWLRSVSRRAGPSTGLGSVMVAERPSSETWIASLERREKSTSASTLPTATRTVRWPLIAGGSSGLSFSMSTMVWKLPVAAL
jgi:hypothetical protein